MPGPFELSGAGLPGELSSLAFGPWQMNSDPGDLDAGLISFSGGDDHGGAAGTLYSVDLSDDPAAAVAALDAGSSSLAGTEARLASLTGRLDLVLELSAGQDTGLVAFDTEKLPASDSQLLGDLVSFDIGGDTGGDIGGDGGDATPIARARAKKRWTDLAGKAREAIEAVLRLATNAAWVETKMRGAPLARTAMGWLGDTETVMTPGAAPDTLVLHNRSVVIAVRTRSAWSRLIALVMQMSAQIARASTNPVSMVGALPMAWEFARGVLTEVETLRQLSRERD